MVGAASTETKAPSLWVRARDSAGMVCCFCRGSLVGSEGVQRCAACATPLHEGCCLELFECPSLGCDLETRHFLQVSGMDALFKASLESEVLHTNGRRTGRSLAEVLASGPLRRLDLVGRRLDGVDLRCRDLRGVDLRAACLVEARLTGADLRRSCARGADLRGVDLREADLRRADLRGADLRGADLRGSRLKGARLDNANLQRSLLDPLRRSWGSRLASWLWGAILPPSQ